MDNKQFAFPYRHYDVIGEMSGDDRLLVEKAREACRTAYAPYSDFRVGAAIRFSDGKILASSNQESRVFPEGMCAERGLLYYAQAQLDGRRIEAIAIASEPGENECYPCGGCRQVLSDTEKRQGALLRVIMCSYHTATVVDSAAALLPFTFEL